MNADDLFGLLSLDQSELHNIKLEEAGKNKSTKRRVLEDLNDDRNIGVSTRKGLSLAQALDIANQLSKAVPHFTMTKRGMTYTTPAKWIVAFVGSLRSLTYQLNMTSFDDGTNLLIVCLTNEPATVGNIEKARQICGKTH